MPTWSPGPMPWAAQVVREPVGALLHLGVGAALPVADEVLAVAEVVDGVLEQIGEVELHRFPSVPLGCARWVLGELPTDMMIVADRPRSRGTLL